MAEKISKSADLCLQRFLETTNEETAFNRMVQQEHKCGYGTSGVCCKLCSNGPCRISPATPRGVCGADADTIAARNFLRSVANGSACYIHVVENAAKRLLDMAIRKEDLPGIQTLERVCGMLNISGFNIWEKAKKISNAVLEDLRRPYEEKMLLVNDLAYSARLKKWAELGVLPGGAKDEIFIANIKTSTNLNSDPVDMLLHCLRLGISTGYYGLLLTNLLNDIMIGEAKISSDPVGMCAIDPECINIMVTGHQQSMITYLTKALTEPDVQGLVSPIAKGIKLVGCTCVGQDLQLRSCQYKEAFCGHAGNNFISEAVLLTGCIDLVVSEFNCTLPGIETICKKQDIPMLCLDDVAKKNGAELIGQGEDTISISANIISTAIRSYASRVGNGKRSNPMAEHGCESAITGVTEVTLKEVLGGTYQPLIEAIAAGKIKGVAAVVGCSNLRTQGHDVLTVEMTKSLIAKDILVLAAGCTCGGLENCGLMSLSAADLAGYELKSVCKSLGIPPVLNFGPCLSIGRIETVAAELAEALKVDIPQLPVVVSAPQWLEEQALADGCFALALGFNLHLGNPPFVTGSQTIVDVLTTQLPNMTGGRLILEAESGPAADKIEAIILEKRKGLGLQ